MSINIRTPSDVASSLMTAKEDAMRYAHELTEAEAKVVEIEGKLEGARLRVQAALQVASSLGNEVFAIANRAPAQSEPADASETEIAPGAQWIDGVSELTTDGITSHEAARALAEARF
jgi:hypothetical protein